MARTTVKRKSESALPTGKKQRKAAPSNKRNASDSTESDSDLFAEEPITAKHVKKSNLKYRKSEPVKVIREDEYEDDPGRTESQQFLSLVELETEKKKAASKEAVQYLEKLSKDIDRDEQSLKKQAEDLTSTWVKKDTGFRGAFKIAFTAATPCPPPAAANQTKDASEPFGFASMYKKSKGLTEGALALVVKFEEVSKHVANLGTATLLDNQWGEEDEKVSHLLRVGKDLGVEKYQSVLLAGRASTMDPVEFVDGEIMYQDGKDQISSVWAKLSKKQEKAARKLVKTFSLEFV